ncbi:protein DpdJ [Rhodospirillales bacterium]|nr:protein DpdJ [Rhodospirillales bacterium]
MNSSNIDQRSVEVALEALEAIEFPSLVWGFVDSHVTEDQLLLEIKKAFEKNHITVDPEDAIAELEERLLVRYWFSEDDRCYRSRFAELVRLTARSRQLFDGRPWRSSPSLVSDFRIDISPRRYPKRDILTEDAEIKIAEKFSLFSNLKKAVWEVALASGGMKSLSQFQVDAIQRILPAPRDSGTIITAGTGSGKTLAFYLPATLVAAERLKKGDFFTKVLSIYPRNELLKDQLTEVYKMTRSMNGALQKFSKPKLSLGALYSQVPHFAGEQAVKEFVKWNKKGRGYLCPFLRCPDCGAETVWRTEDLEKKIERLACTECEFLSAQDELRLTRSSIQATPPDFLFTTTEMLNQRMSDTGMRRLFGIGCDPEKKPSYILLDEVHTYNGVTGAQTALLLRRWRKMLSNPVHWVGLSATLEEAPQFFEDLTGVSISNIQEITPNLADMEEEGADYQLLVRSDPSSQAATLSTSIQALMLLARMLDPEMDNPSKGLFGRRVFAFTDDLDVINRLYDNFRDAEAYKPWRINDPDPNREPLARLRSRDLPDADERDLDGQLWSLAEDLRGSLINRLSVGRTSSRDPGVLSGSDVVVATASLEVGFNDPDVGAVLQHKAPRSNASFVQRKGRAGRRRGMRPIMMTILSDYGRDRLAFQSYEELFSPQIERQRLPVNNGYILRMQAVCALFDWIAHLASRERAFGWSWQELSKPKDSKTHCAFLKIAKEVIQDLVRLEPVRLEAFRDHLTKSLQIDKHELDLLLWEQPRSLLLEVLPTLARRIFTDWRLADDPEERDFFTPYHPLPDFIPSNLFGELNLPEVKILVPPSSQYEKEREEHLRIRQALSEFTPGKVRRRFADTAGNIAHWFPLDPNQDAQVIDIHNYAERHEFLGDYPVSDIGLVRMYRPYVIQVEGLLRQQQISHTSTSSWDWQSGFEFLGNANSVELSHHAAWKNVIPKLNFYIHRLASAVTVRRYAHSGIANLRVNGVSQRIEFKLVEGDPLIPASIGFAYESDGICIPLNLPDDDDFDGLNLPMDVSNWLTTLRYRDDVLNDADLPKSLNSFRRDWLVQVVWHAALVISEERSITLSEAFDKIAEDDDAHELKPSIAQTVSSEIISDPSEAREAQLEKTLLSDLEDDGVLLRICKIGSSVFTKDPSIQGAWRKKVFAQTLAEAALQACILSTPKNTALEGLSVDLVDENGKINILIVESTLGGGGTVEALSEVFSSDPRAFYKAMEAALAPSDTENAAVGLAKILMEITKESEPKEILSELRRAQVPRERDNIRAKFARSLSSQSIQFSRSLGVSFSTRFVKTGASSASDEVTKQIFGFWDALEKKHQVSLPVRLLASVVDMDMAIKSSLANIGGVGKELSTAERLLWPRGGELRQYGIQSYNPYRDAWISDPGLARAVVSGNPVQVVSIDNSDWSIDVTEQLRNVGEVGLTTSQSMRDLVKGVVDFISRPVTVRYHNFYPVIDAYRETPDGMPEIVIALREKV